AAPDFDVVRVCAEKQDLERSRVRFAWREQEPRSAHFWRRPLPLPSPSTCQTYHGGFPDACSSSSFALSFAVSIGTQKPSYVYASSLFCSTSRLNGFSTSSSPSWM